MDLPEGLNSHDQDLIRRLTEFIEENIEDSNLNADIMAGHIAMSKTQLYRKIKALTGLTPHRLINNLRLKKAAAALLTSEKRFLKSIMKPGSTAGPISTRPSRNPMAFRPEIIRKWSMGIEI